MGALWLEKDKLSLVVFSGDSTASGSFYLATTAAIWKWMYDVLSRFGV
jgi:hypothetical protein